MKKPVVIGLGEILWDIFPEYKRAGGAPANVAFHARLLGNEGIPASRLGEDENGKELLGLLENHGLDCSWIQIDSEAPTGTVQVNMQDGEADYTIHRDVAWERLELSDQWKDLAAKAHAVCFGTLAQRSEQSRETILEFLGLTGSSCLKVADINLREPFYTPDTVETTLEQADVVKMNQDEWKILSNWAGTTRLQDHLFDQKKVSIICLTKGAEGAEIITPELHLIEPVFPVDNSQGDSVGVGDAFTACLTHHLLQKSPLDVGIAAANKYAAQVAARKGAMPEIPPTIIKSVTGRGD